MISIIIPLYNKEKFIEATIHSVLGQTFQDFEVIVVNDGSTDSSVEKIKEFDDTRIKLITIQNSGVSVARNTGIKNASFDWIALLDADDWWAPTFLSEIANAITKFPKEQIFATGRSRVFNQETERYSHKYLPKDGKTAICNYYKTISEFLPLINSSNVVINKNLFKSYGYFRNGQTLHEDHDLWMRLCVDAEVVFINKPLSFYRKTEANTASNSRYSFIDFNTYIKTINAVYTSVSDEEKKYIKAYANRFIALMYIKHYWGYSREEQNELWKNIDTFTYGKYRKLCKMTKWVPFNLYPVLKVFKR